MNFGEKLKQLRKDHHLSQEELAQILNVSRQTISRWESSITTPDLAMLEKICHYFHISYNDFLEDKKAKKISIYYFLCSFIFLIIISFLMPTSQQDLLFMLA